MKKLLAMLLSLFLSTCCVSFAAEDELHLYLDIPFAKFSPILPINLESLIPNMPFIIFSIFITKVSFCDRSEYGVNIADTQNVF